jgi:hypothetical protein
MGVGGQRHASTAIPRGMTPYSLYMKLGRPQGRSGQVRKISTPPGFDPRNVQPVASRCSDCVSPARTSNTVQMQLRAGSNVRLVVMVTTSQEKCLDNKMFVHE